MRKSKAATLFVALLGGALFLAMPHAKAWPSKGAVKGWCDKVGGVYFPPSRRGAYACLAPNGDFIVCGGYIGPNSHYAMGATRVLLARVLLESNFGGHWSPETSTSPTREPRNEKAPASDRGCVANRGVRKSEGSMSRQSVPFPAD